MDKKIDLDVLYEFLQVNFVESHWMPEGFVRVVRNEWGDKPQLRIYIGGHDASLLEDGSSPSSGGSLIGPWKIEYVGCEGEKEDE